MDKSTSLGLGISIPLIAIVAVIILVFFYRRAKTTQQFKTDIEASTSEKVMTEIKTRTPIPETDQDVNGYSTNLSAGQPRQMTRGASPRPQLTSFPSRPSSRRSPTPIPVRPFGAQERVMPPLGSTLIAISAWEPRLPDQLEVSVGDKVVLTHVFNDGWGMGRNVSMHSLREGLVPVNCLGWGEEEEVEAVEEVESSGMKSAGGSPRIGSLTATGRSGSGGDWKQVAGIWVKE
ncbi:hypothetical protein HDU76_010985 [Blyttiomyces sp. JEL0837]|nr:hypothetical protein HDU76_010985 [Blyttiomyces sp. JEL0837]